MRLLIDGPARTSLVGSGLWDEGSSFQPASVSPDRHYISTTDRKPGLEQLDLKERVWMEGCPGTSGCVDRGSISKRPCEAAKSASQRLSTSVLPFPAFLLSLSLSVVITVKVQLRRLGWELSQRCVATM
ncbi:unnamed protein product [Pleuronectes platessa]|uniref:Uncharacterized protein n=1 Tax=Pleuronectes platessa TaxID=8262 RepID=A0A9N7YSZ1_PLEPL|nr:unnamed protein product [Pleuronectes platessa]